MLFIALDRQRAVHQTQIKSKVYSISTNTSCSTSPQQIEVVEFGPNFVCLFSACLVFW